MNKDFASLKLKFNSGKKLAMHDFTSQNIIFIIAAGVLTFVILFIFAKRQITRFALRSRRGPHVPIGADAKKVSATVDS